MFFDLRTQKIVAASGNRLRKSLNQLSNRYTVLMPSSLIKTIVQFALPSIVGVAVSWGMHQARLESLERELYELRQDLGGHETNESWSYKFNELLQLLNRLDTHLSRQ